MVAAMSRCLGMVVVVVVFSLATILITKQMDVALRWGQRGNWGLRMEQVLIWSVWAVC